AAQPRPTARTRRRRDPPRTLPPDNGIPRSPSSLPLPGSHRHDQHVPIDPAAPRPLRHRNQYVARPAARAGRAIDANFLAGCRGLAIVADGIADGFRAFAVRALHDTTVLGGDGYRIAAVRVALLAHTRDRDQRDIAAQVD